MFLTLTHATLEWNVISQPYGRTTTIKESLATTAIQPLLKTLAMTTTDDRL